ncbi:MAG: hypothetical protein WCL32_19500 [Planctomycetota bacterium]
MNETTQQLRDDDQLAELTDIAYRALLRQGLTRSFVDVELELWAEIRKTFRRLNEPVHHLALAAS